jgi:hypothetical protein
MRTLRDGGNLADDLQDLLYEATDAAYTADHQPAINLANAIAERDARQIANAVIIIADLSPRYWS